MPKSKPATLNTRHDTKEEAQARAAAEAALTPKTELSLKPPTVLNGHKVAKETWARVVGLYNEIDGKIATAFDEDGLVKYCLLEEEVIEMAIMRDDIKKDWKSNRTKANLLKDPILKAKTFEIVNALLTRYQGMDARLDGKRKLLHTLAQSLYLTPRSRAGVEPPTKEPDVPKSEMEGLL